MPPWTRVRSTERYPLPFTSCTVSTYVSANAMWAAYLRLSQLSQPLPEFICIVLESLLLHVHTLDFSLTEILEVGVIR